MAVVCSEPLSFKPKSLSKELQQSTKAVSVWMGMGTRAACNNHVQITWKHHVFTILLLVLVLALQGMTFYLMLFVLYVDIYVNNYMGIIYIFSTPF